MLESNCTFCGIRFTYGRSSTGKYCSLKCQGAHTTNRVIDTWKAEPTKENYYTGNQVRKSIRGYLLEQAGCKCSQCGWDKKHPSSLLPPLEVDHIDGDWTNCAPSNLRVICPNCHSLTDTYKSRNRGKGRHGRKVVSSM